MSWMDCCRFINGKYINKDGTIDKNRLFEVLKKDRHSHVLKIKNNKVKIDGQDVCMNDNHKL